MNSWSVTSSIYFFFDQIFLDLNRLVLFIYAIIYLGKDRWILSFLKLRHAALAVCYAAQLWIPDSGSRWVLLSLNCNIPSGSSVPLVHGQSVLDPEGFIMFNKENKTQHKVCL